MTESNNEFIGFVALVLILGAVIISTPNENFSDLQYGSDYVGQAAKGMLTEDGLATSPVKEDSTAIKVPPTEAQCTDTDGGVEYYIFGVTSAGKNTKKDNCQDSSKLIEYYCSRNNKVTAMPAYACDYGCEGGVCRSEPPEYCGDGEINGDESCDGTDLGGFLCADFGEPAYTGGTLSCFPPGSSNECEFDFSQCEYEVAFCGDGVINNLPNEECDGNELNGLTCLNLGFAGGILLCDGACQFNTTGCYANITVQIVSPNPNSILSGVVNTDADVTGPVNMVQFLLGNGTNNVQLINMTGPLYSFPFDTTSFPNNHYPDFPYYNLIAYAYGPEGSYAFDMVPIAINNSVPEYCGDGIISGLEVCDGTNLNGFTCMDFGNFVGGTLSCFPPGSPNECTFDLSQCTLNQTDFCGDGVANGMEQCDGTDLRVSCSDINGFVGGILGCYPSGSAQECMWDTSNCDLGYGFCGDSLINNYPNEACDGNAWGQIEGCADFGFQGGTLTCNPYVPGETGMCQFDTSLCLGIVGFCGNGIINPGEECEPSLPFVVSCLDFDSFTGGIISCTADCTYDINQCSLNQTEFCGDGIMNNFPNEECDGEDISLSCTDIGSFIGGILGCNPDCTFNTSQCISPSLLSVISSPPLAMVYVDNITRGYTPVTVSGLTVGNHDVKLTKTGYYTYNTIISINAGVTTSLNVTLNQTPVPTCNDTDGMNYSNKGSVFGVAFYGNNSYNYNYTDFCLSSLQVIEYWCAGSQPMNSTVSCTCSNGACQNNAISRTFSTNPATGNTLMTVTITKTLISGQTTVLAEEYVPAGFVIIDDGVGIAAGNTIRWAELAGASSGTYTYTVQTPNSPGTYTFNGLYSINGGLTQSIAGSTQSTIQ